MSTFKTKFGLPVVNADNIVDFVRTSGIINWKVVTEPIPIENYPENSLTDKEKKFKRRLQVKVSQFLSPDGDVFRGFCIEGLAGTRVFTLLEKGLVPVCAEFQHGCGEVLFDLPGGVLEAGENLYTCAKREFEEESGIVLKSVTSLSPAGMPIMARYFRARNFSFLGIPGNPVELKLQKLDSNEYMKTVLIGLDDWLKLIDREVVQAYSVSTTFLALRRLGILTRG